MEENTAKKESKIKKYLHRYFIDAMSAMAQGLFASLLIGTIISTLGTQLNIPVLDEIGGYAKSAAGPAMAVAIGYALEAPPLVLFSLVAVGGAANTLGGAGGPLAVLVLAIVAAELGRLVSRKTKIDIIVTPLVTIFSGCGLAYLIAPYIGAAVAGCCAQMIGFAVISFRENGWGGFFAQGIGTSMLQVPNIIKNPRIWIAPTLASAITGPLATCLFGMQMNGAPISSGMGTCGLVGQIGVYTGWLADIAAGTKAAVTAMDWTGLVLICFILPALLSFVFDLVLRKINWVKPGDMKLDI